MNRKFKIVIEGNGEGAGKSTMIAKLKDKYSDLFDYRIEPDKISRAELFKPENINLPLSDKIRLFKESRDRTNLESLDSKVTICDRGAMSSYVYQGIVDGNEIHRQQIKDYILAESDIATEFYIVLHNDYEDLKSRRLASGRDINTYDLLPDEFHQNVFKGYDQVISNFKEIFGTDNIIVIDCKGKSIDETFELLDNAVNIAVEKMIFTKSDESKDDNPKDINNKCELSTLLYNLSGFSLDIPTYNTNINGRTIVNVLTDIFGRMGYRVECIYKHPPLSVNTIVNMVCSMDGFCMTESNLINGAIRSIFKVDDRLICELIMMISQTIYNTRKYELELDMIQSIVTKQYFDWFATYSKNDFYTILSLFTFNKGPISGIHNGVVISESPMRFTPVYDKGKMVCVSTYYRENPKNTMIFRRHTCVIKDNGLEVTNTKKNLKNKDKAIEYFGL